LDNEVCGFRVRRIREFNIVLLGKWGWTLAVDKKGIWFRSLATRYGVVGGGCRRVVGKGWFGGGHNWYP